jgi:hypothetical protein
MGLEKVSELQFWCIAFIIHAVMKIWIGWWWWWW